MAIRINETIKGFGYLYYDLSAQTLEFRRKDDAMARELDRQMEMLLDKRRDSVKWQERWLNEHDPIGQKERERQRQKEEDDLEKKIDEMKKAEVDKENAKHAEELTKNMYIRWNVEAREREQKA